ncbi:MAG: hypothetical protein HY549_02755 [Elusimicrobia bacterium]|nr:hypothetical protein [Elusimicrobiota bacterium]
MRRIDAALAVFVLSWLGTWGCGAAREMARAAPGRDEAAVRLKVPFFPDDVELCAPASLASVLSYWSRPVDVGSLKEQVIWPSWTARCLWT